MKETFSNLKTYCNTVFLQTMHELNKMISLQDYCTHTERKNLLLNLSSKGISEKKLFSDVFTKTTTHLFYTPTKDHLMKWIYNSD